MEYFKKIRISILYYNNDEYQFSKPYSEETARLIDQEVQKMVGEQYERAKRILTEKSEGHGQLAQLLVDREVIFAEDVEHIFGPRPWASRADEIIEGSEETETENQRREDHDAETK